MFFVVDLIIIGIILLFTFLGYKRGLVKLALGLCTFFIAIIIAFIFYKPIANLLINNTNFDESIENTITSKILPEGVSENEEIDMSNLSTSLPSVILKNSSNTIASISQSISHTLIESICFLGLFIIAKIALKFVTILADLIAKLPILKQFNELGGIIYGVLEGLITVFTLLAIISLVAPLLDSSNAIISNINNSIIGSLLYNNNILLKFIM